MGASAPISPDARTRRDDGMSKNSAYEPPFTILVDRQQIDDEKHRTLMTAIAAQREFAERYPGRKVQIFDCRWEEVSFRRELRGKG
jgi:hypothetical protein